MSPGLANFLFEAANFVVLAAGLGWVLFKPVRRALDAERERHDKERLEAEKLREEAETLAERARTSREQAEQELEAERKKVLEAARNEATELIEDARKRASGERQALREELDAMRAAQTAALSSRVGEVAAQAVRALLEHLPGPSLDLALVEAACKQLETLPASARRDAVVESARSLDTQARSRLQRALGAPVSERVVPELGAGVRVTGAGGQVDATAASIARRAGQAIRELELEPTTERPVEARRG